MNGKGFRPFVSARDSFKKGQKFLEFSIEDIWESGYKDTVAVIISNGDQFQSVEVIPDSTIDNNKAVIEVK